MKKQKTRILIADDHSVVRKGLRKLFEHERNYVIVGEASDGDRALELTLRHKPDVAILDVSMPGKNGIEVTRLIRQRNSNTKILILTIHEEEEYVSEVIRSGANGYVLKNAEGDEIVSAVKAVASGDKFFSAGVSNLILEGFMKNSQKHQPQPAFLRRLSPRETEVLRFVAQGLTSRRIAELLSLSVRTVDTHRNNIMKKLAIHSTAGLIRFALHRGIVKDRP